MAAKAALLQNEQLRTPVPMPILFSRELKISGAHPGKPQLCARGAGGSLPQRCPDLCPAVGFHLALSSAAPVSAPNLYFIACCSFRVPRLLWVVMGTSHLLCLG